MKLIAALPAMLVSVLGAFDVSAAAEHADFAVAFQEGARVSLRSEPDATGVIRIKTIAEAVVTTGSLVASDGIVILDAIGFDRSVPVGRYPVLLSVAELPNGDQRVACAKVQLSNEPAARWVMATVPGQDLAALQSGEIYGYPVDSGTGGFMDVEAVRYLNADPAHYDSYFERAFDEMQRNYVHTWNWSAITVVEPSGANVVAFSSGFGDGHYASYWGVRADGTAVALVTDFGLV